MENAIASQLTKEQLKAIEMGNEINRLRQLLVDCRQIMRGHGIGHLFPGTTEGREAAAEWANRSGDANAMRFVARINSEIIGARETQLRSILNWLYANHPEILFKIPVFEGEVNLQLEFKERPNENT